MISLRLGHGPGWLYEQPRAAQIEVLAVLRVEAPTSTPSSSRVPGALDATQEAWDRLRKLEV